MTTPATPIDPQAALYAALAKAQAQFPPIEKSRTVTVRMDNGGTYTFDYAPLDAIIDATRPVLQAHGLCVSQVVESVVGLVGVRTILAHATGGNVEGWLPVPDRKAKDGATDLQKLGGAITYIRRYAYAAILGVCAETDDDGNHAAGNDRTLTPRAPAQRAAPAPATPPRNNPATAPQAPAQDNPPNAGPLEYLNPCVGQLFDWRVLKTGKTARGDWTLYLAELDTGHQFTTLEEGLAPIAESLLGKTVIINWGPGKQPGSHNIKSMEIGE